MHSSQPFAVLDLGSYNFHLLIAQFDGKVLQPLHECKHITELASGLNSNKQLQQASVARALRAITELAPLLAELPRQHIHVFGTGSLRQASNAADFIQAAEQLLQAPIDVIAGEQEAELVFLGANHGCNLSEPTLIIDIGGGSTEFIIGQTTADFLSSICMGGLEFADRYFACGKVCHDNYEQALKQARTMLSGIRHELQTHQWQTSLGASGIIRSIEAVINSLCPEPNITLDNIEFLADRLCKQGDCRYIRCPENSSIRPEVLPGGLVILHAIMLELKISKLETTAHSIREGAIFKLYNTIYGEQS